MEEENLLPRRPSQQPQGTSSLLCLLLAVALVLFLVYVCYRLLLPNKPNLPLVIKSPSFPLTPQSVYSYCYPLVLTEMTRKYEIEHKLHTFGQFNHLVHHRELATASSLPTVVSPNDSTLYSDAWIRLPLDLTIPVIEAPGRYFVVAVLDGFGNVLFLSDGSIVHSKRTVHLDPAFYPGAVWLILRVFCDGSPEDLEAAHDIQNQFFLESEEDMASREEGKIERCPHSPSSMVDQMSPATFYQVALSLLETPQLSFYPETKEVAFFVSQHSNSNSKSTLLQTYPHTLRHLPQECVDQQLVQLRNQWLFTTQMGKFPTHNLAGIETRAFFTRVLFAAALWPSACYYLRLNLNPLHSYQMILDPLPPQFQGFWSLTSYNYDFFLPKGSPKPSIHSYDVTLTTPLKLRVLPLTLFRQLSPTEQQASIAVEDDAVDKFHLIFRVYGPGPDILSLGWTPPPLFQLNQDLSS